MYGFIPIFRNTLRTDTPNYLHHCSMYGITEHDAKIQVRLGNTKYRELTHYSSELVIDTDNYETSNLIYNELVENDIIFELWRLNNYKFYLPRDNDDYPSEIMCFQDREFVRSTFKHCNIDNGLDLGIYSSPFHLCRAKGAIHEVTGKKSELVYSNIGSKKVSTSYIELTQYERPAGIFDSNRSTWDTVLGILNSVCTSSYSNRHNCFFGLGRDLRELMSYVVAEELIMIYASTINYEVDKAIRAFEQGYNS